MIIESDFKDYYDIVQESISDIVFKRKTKSCDPVSTFKVKNIFSDHLKTVKMFYNEKQNWYITFFIIGFCGTLYKGMLIKNYKDIDASYTYTGSIYLPSKLGINIESEIKQHSKDHFNDCFIKNNQLFDIIKVPYFIITPNKFNIIRIYCNPNLADYLFNKVKNSYQAYSEIRKYISYLVDKDSTVFCTRVSIGV